MRQLWEKMLLAVVCGAAMGGVLFLGGVRPTIKTAQGDNEIIDSINVKVLRIINDQGQVAGVISTTDDRAGLLMLSNATGKPSVLLSSVDSGGYVELKDTNGVSRLTVHATSTCGGYLAFKNTYRQGIYSLCPEMGVFGR